MDIVKDLLFFLIYVLIKLGDFASYILFKIKYSVLFIVSQFIKSIHSFAGTTVQSGSFLLTKFILLKKINIVLPGKSSVIYPKASSVHSAPKISKRHYEKGAKKRAYRATFFYKLRFFLFGGLFSFVFIFLPLLVLIFVAQLPNPYNLSVNSIPKTTKILDRNGNLLYEIYANNNRTIVGLSEVPQYLKDATVAIEDKDFYNHPGFDVRGITRSIFNNLSDNDGLQGGSTITQQLIRSAFLSTQQSVTRKIKEITLAFFAERIYPKNKILELYFNYVPYGGMSWGVQAASETYFGKNVSDLTLAESAFLAGMPKAPSIYSPFNSHNSLWKQRQEDVLKAMEKYGYITQKEADIASREELVFKSPRVPIRAPHFVMYVKDMLVKRYGLNEVERGGLKVLTSLDIDMQETAERIVQEEIENDAYLNIKNGATVIADPKTGDILAMVGNHNYFDKTNGGNVNIATSLRQPGSTIKMVTYALALSSGLTESTVIDDSPISIPLTVGYYSPVNYDGRYHGRIPLRYAFGNSFNIPAVRVAQRVGVDNIIEFGKKLGIESWSETSGRHGLSITLGAAEVTMLDMVRVYGTIANDGKRTELDPILEITDTEGKQIYKKPNKDVQVIDSGVAFIISDILADNNARTMAFGPNSPLKIPGHRVSVKTGTTDYKRDNWTIGFNKDYVIATWVGNNDNSPMSEYLVSGITGAAPMWNKIMTTLLKNRRDGVVSVPENVIKKRCNGYDAYFLKGTENSAGCGLNFNAPTSTPTPTPLPEFIYYD